MNVPNRSKPFVQLAIDAVDTVILDPEGSYDPEFHDRYATFESARDAALTSIEVMLDEADYDDEYHRQELARMHELLDGSRSFGDLAALPGYQWFLRRLSLEGTIASGIQAILKSA